jgi:uncharacterized protein
MSEGSATGGSPKGARTIRCPECGGPSVYSPDNAFRPFCSARCKNHDFGAWASGQYALPAQPTNPDEGSDLSPDADPGLPH